MNRRIVPPTAQEAQRIRNAMQLSEDLTRWSEHPKWLRCLKESKFRGLVIRTMFCAYKCLLAEWLYERAERRFLARKEKWIRAFEVYAQTSSDVQNSLEGSHHDSPT